MNIARRAIECVLKKDYTDAELVYQHYTDILPDLSIVMPIHNQEEIIQQNIQAILKNTINATFEIILVVDACSDKTLEKVLDFFKTNTIPENLKHIAVLQSLIPLFETAADNLGFICSRGDYIIEIQADIQILDEGYNTRMIKPFLQNKNVIGVSGRCCHGITYSNGVGKMGYEIEKPLATTINKDKFYVAETCNRGPLMLDRKKLEQLNYLDQDNYFLDNSDHDLFARAYAQKGFICGYVPIEFSAPLIHGSTRKPRDSLNQKYYDIKKQQCKNGGFLEKYITQSPRSRPIYTIDLE